MPELETEVASLDQQKGFEKARRRTRKTGNGKDATTAAAAPAPSTPPEKADPQQQAGYFMDADGLWFIGKKGDAFLPAAWVCAPFRVRYRARGIDGLGWRVVLVITDRDGAERDVILLDADIGGQDGGWHRALSDAGLKIHPRRRGELGQYLLMECDGAPRARGVEKTGLFGNAFVLHDRTIGRSGEPFIYMGADRAGVFSVSGTADDWRQHVGRYAPGNARMILAICSSLAAPLLPMSGIGESGGFHLFGLSSGGKTTLARVAASAWALPADYLTTWRNTSNATEGTAAKFNHFLLGLDEIREAAERDLQATIMMLGNGRGKARMTDRATLRESMTWLLLWLSTGEYATEHYLESIGVKADPGMAIRQVDIPADAGKNLGVFETVHGMRTAKALAEHLRQACDDYHGAIGVDWLEYITANIETIRRDLPGHVTGMVDNLAKDHAAAESQVLRALRRFALLAVAGERASHAGLTGWAPGVATAGVRACMNAWLEHRGGGENLEKRRFVQRLEEFLSKHWSGRFVVWDRANDSHAPGKDGVVGLRREIDGDWHFYITAPGWVEIYRGMDPVAAAHTLAEAKLLELDSNGRPNRREYLPGYGRVRCYQPVPAFLADCDLDKADDHV